MKVSSGWVHGVVSCECCGVQMVDGDRCVLLKPERLPFCSKACAVEFVADRAEARRGSLPSIVRRVG
jgi:hypothetical protein